MNATPDYAFDGTHFNHEGLRTQHALRCPPAIRHSNSSSITGRHCLKRNDPSGTTHPHRLSQPADETTFLPERSTFLVIDRYPLTDSSQSDDKQSSPCAYIAVEKSSAVVLISNKCRARPACVP